ncbi:MAG: Gfo/Idh/MocA family oxidoreductase [Armatimonadota bacterium]|nr:Gfo/Idh/MocA family oxidoreductase [Armatimonadota bacterium]
MGVRVGVIGMGLMGRRHLEALGRDDRAEIVGVADVVPQAARAAAAPLGARACGTLAELAGLGIDAVIVASPNVHHGAMVLEALDRGLHVLSEKPMATTLDEGRRIRDRVRAGDRVYQIGFNRRWSPSYRFLRERVAGGFVPYSASVKINDGDMLTPSWYADAAVSGGFMYDTAVHLFDMIAWLVGPIERVAAVGRKSCYPDYDDIAMWLTCRDGRPVGFTTCGHASWAAPQERVELYGDHALLASEDLDRARYATRDEPHTAWRQFPSPDAVTLWGYVGEDRAFIDACLGLAPPPVTVDEAFHSLAVLDAAYASLAAGGVPVRVAVE